jgi:hypothetical protein
VKINFSKANQALENHNGRLIALVQALNTTDTELRQQMSGSSQGVDASLLFFIVHLLSLALLLCGRTGRLTGQNGGFRPGQSGDPDRAARGQWVGWNKFPL